jgi:hypothetical protein
MRFYRVALLILAGAACAGTGAAVGSNPPAATKVVTAGVDFDLAPGETAVVDDGALSVNFVKVGADSRCPTGVQCVWAGDGAVSLTASTPSASKDTATLHTTLTPKTAKAGAYEISLVGLKPYPKQGSKIPPATYVATLHIIRQ